jgi:ABC-type amino acid transport substrate-binding protein
MCQRLCIAVLLAVLANPSAAAVLEGVQSAGALHCGVDTAVPGYSAQTKATGMAADFCRAVAAAVIGDGSKVVFSVLTAAEQVEALQSGEIDVLVAAIPMSSQREMAEGLLFAGPLYFDDTGAAVTAYGPLVRQSDDQWFLAVAAVRNYLIRAELHAEGEVLLVTSGGQDMGPKVLATTGHYGDIFVRSFGQDKKRGKNQGVENGGWLWTPEP